MGLEGPRRVRGAFAKDARILISTDASGEGLQFCHVVREEASPGFAGLDKATRSNYAFVLKLIFNFKN